MKHITESKAIEILRKHADSEKSFQHVLAHVKAVQTVSLRIASQCHSPLDTELIRIGSLLHDIGRFAKLTGKERIRHGIIGADILRREGLPEEYARICERHIGVGIKKEDIIKQGLPLPVQDYVPVSKEEKIIAHVDNLVFGSEEKTFQDVLDRFAKELGEDYVRRAKELKREIESF